VDGKDDGLLVDDAFPRYDNTGDNLTFNYITIQVSAAADRPARRGASRHHAVLCTDVDGQCDQLVTDDRHQFNTLTVHLS